MEKEKVTTYRGVRIDDTTEWHLTIYVSKTGMSAYLRNVENPLEPVVTLFEENWDVEESGLLERIESAVYDHPQLLDDFSTDIVVCCGHPLWVPAEYAEDLESGAPYYTEIYGGQEDDVMEERTGAMVSLFSLCPGLRAFFQRTLSGARIHSQQGALVRRFAERGGEMPRIYIDIRDGEADFIALDNRNLLLGATHQWRELSDIEYHLYNIIDVYGLDRKHLQVSLSGDRKRKTALMKSLRGDIGFVMLTMLPTAVSKTDMPLAAAVARN